MGEAGCEQTGLGKSFIVASALLHAYLNQVLNPGTPMINATQHSIARYDLSTRSLVWAIANAQFYYCVGLLNITVS